MKQTKNKPVEGDPEWELVKEEGGHLHPITFGIVVVGAVVITGLAIGALAICEAFRSFPKRRKEDA